MKAQTKENIIVVLFVLTVIALIVVGSYIENAGAVEKNKVATYKERIIYATANQIEYQKNGYELFSVAYGPECKWLVIRSGEFVNGEFVVAMIKERAAEWKMFGFTEVMITTGEATAFVDVQKAYDLSIKKETM